MSDIFESGYADYYKMYWDAHARYYEIRGQ